MARRLTPRLKHKTRLKLSDASQPEREEYMEWVRRECIELRDGHEPAWLDLYEEWRNITDVQSPYRNKVRSTYAFTAVMAQVAVLEPLFFASEPVVEIASQWEDDWPNNTAHENIITKQIHARSNFRKQWASILMEAAVFGSSYPYTNFRTRKKLVGPFPNSSRTQSGGSGPILGPDGVALNRQEYREVQLYRGPELRYTSLWDTYVHPDGVRGFSVHDFTGYELVEASSGPNPLFDPERVKRAIKVAEREISGGPKSDRDEMNFSFGDDHLADRDQLAQLTGTEAGLRHFWHQMDPSLRKNVMAFPFPVFFYDDGEFSGAYMLSRDGRFMELRFFRGASVDGTPNRIALTPFQDPGNVYGIGLLEIGLGLIQARTRFLQLALDGAELTVHPQWTVSDTYDRLNGEIMVGPGAVNVVPALGGRIEDHIQRMDMPQSWVNALQAREQVITPELDDLFQQDEHTKGQFPTGRHTAATANLVGSANAARTELVADRIDTFFARPLLRKWDALNRAFFSKRDYEDYLGKVGAADVNQVPPEDFLRRNEYIFKGSVLSSTKAQLLTRYPQMAQMYLNALPLMQVPHVQEYFKRWFRDAGFESITRLFPPADGTVMSEYAILSGGGGGTFSGMPRSPTDAAGILGAAGNEGAAEGGATAPPPPRNDLGAAAAGTGQSSASQRLSNIL